MKRLKTKSKYISQYDMCPYNMDLIVAISDKGLEKLGAWGIVHGEECYSGGGSGGGTYKIPDYTSVVVYIHSDDVEVLAHESVHVMSAILEHTGIRYDHDNDEAYAYMLGKIALHMKEAWDRAHTKKAKKK